MKTNAKGYMIKLVRDYPSASGLTGLRWRGGTVYPFNDKIVLKSLENALSKNERKLNEKKYNKILAEAITGNKWAEIFIKLWNSENIKEEWCNLLGFSFSDPPVELDGYLNKKGEFSKKINKNTYFFQSKKDAKNYLVTLVIAPYCEIVDQIK